MAAVDQLRHLPFGAAEQIQPTRGSHVISSSLRRTRGSSLDIWDIPSGDYDWSPHADHSLLVIRGSASLQLADGRVVQLAPGATVFLPRGVGGTWQVKAAIRAVSLLCP